MSEVTSRIPFDRTTGKYKKDWHATQEAQVSRQITVISSSVLLTLNFIYLNTGCPR